MRAVSTIVRAIDFTNEWVGRIVAVGILLMVAIVGYEVVMRYGFRAPTLWATELITFVFAGYIFLGAGYTLLHRDHVGMDIVYSRLTARGQAVLDVLTAAFVFLYCFVLISTGWDTAWSALQSGRTTGTDWNPPLFPAAVLLPVGTALLLLQAIGKFVRDLVLIFTGRDLSHGH
jgi:TRAP-type mannitol/chloroaromatic compound transport system permease small subunit